MRVICGEFWGKKGPVEGVAADPSYLDVSVGPGRRKRLKIETTRNAFAYVFAGSGTFDDASDPRAVLTERVGKPEAPPVYDVGNHSLVLFDRGDEIMFRPAMRVSVFCWYRGSRSRSRLHGTARL